MYWERLPPLPGPGPSGQLPPPPHSADLSQPPHSHSHHHQQHSHPQLLHRTQSEQQLAGTTNSTPPLLYTSLAVSMGQQHHHQMLPPPSPASSCFSGRHHRRRFSNGSCSSNGSTTDSNFSSPASTPGPPEPRRLATAAAAATVLGSRRRSLSCSPQIGRHRRLSDVHPMPPGLLGGAGVIGGGGGGGHNVLPVSPSGLTLAPRLRDRRLRELSPNSTLPPGPRPRRGSSHNPSFYHVGPSSPGTVYRSLGPGPLPYPAALPDFFPSPPTHSRHLPEWEELQSNHRGGAPSPASSTMYSRLPPLPAFAGMDHHPPQEPQPHEQLQRASPPPPSSRSLRMLASPEPAASPHAMPIFRLQQPAPAPAGPRGLPPPPPPPPHPSLVNLGTIRAHSDSRAAAVLVAAVAANLELPIRPAANRLPQGVMIPERR